MPENLSVFGDERQEKNKGQTDKQTDRKKYEKINKNKRTRTMSPTIYTLPYTSEFIVEFFYWLIKYYVFFISQILFIIWL